MIITNKDWLSSDLHFFHRNVIQYCNRPFSSVEEMNEALINNWNSVIGSSDRVFFLGDFSFGGVQVTTDVLSRLHGYKICIKGNHDRGRNKLVEMGFQEALLNLEFTYEGKTGFMQHVPARDKRDKYDLILCGHAHIAFIKDENIYNVGCDTWDYTPQTIDFILENAESRQKQLTLQLNVDSAWEARDDKIIANIEGCRGNEKV